jgi:hypothetical protein
MLVLPAHHRGESEAFDTGNDEHATVGVELRTQHVRETRRPVYVDTEQRVVVTPAGKLDSQRGAYPRGRTVSANDQPALHPLVGAGRAAQNGARDPSTRFDEAGDARPVPHVHSPARLRGLDQHTLDLGMGQGEVGIGDACEPERHVEQKSRAMMKELHLIGLARPRGATPIKRAPSREQSGDWR